ncbi:FlgN protein [compost metagenome]
MDSFGTSPADNLIEEHKAVRALTQLLQLEQEHLIAANVEGITAVTEEKGQLATRMAELAKWRHNALAAAGFEPTESSMKLWLESAQSPTASKAWQELVELAEAAKELNRVNGILINKQMVRNQTVLNILQHGTEQGNNVYGPNGQTASKSVGRHIVTG